MEELRKMIDETDREITKLFEKRMNIVSQVAKYKKENNVPLTHTTREQQVIDKNIAVLENKDLAPYLKEFYLSLMDISKKYQTELNK